MLETHWTLHPSEVKVGSRALNSPHHVPLCPLQLTRPKAGPSVQAGKVLPPTRMAKEDLQTSWLSGIRSCNTSEELCQTTSQRYQWSEVAATHLFITKRYPHRSKWDGQETILANVTSPAAAGAQSPRAAVALLSSCGPGRHGAAGHGNPDSQTNEGQQFPWVGKKWNTNDTLSSI